MTNVQFGVQYNGVSMSAVIGPLEFARRMESLGYRSFFVPELETLPTLDPFILLAAVAQHTERMRLGTGVAVPLALAAARFRSSHARTRHAVLQYTASARTRRSFPVRGQSNNLCRRRRTPMSTRSQYSRA